jgi:hypothetical protein
VGDTSWCGARCLTSDNNATQGRKYLLINPYQFNVNGMRLFSRARGLELNTIHRLALFVFNVERIAPKYMAPSFPSPSRIPTPLNTPHHVYNDALGISKCFTITDEQQPHFYLDVSDRLSGQSCRDS